MLQLWSIYSTAVHPVSRPQHVVAALDSAQKRTSCHLLLFARFQDGTVALTEILEYLPMFTVCLDTLGYFSRLTRSVSRPDQCRLRKIQHQQHDTARKAREEAAPVVRPNANNRCPLDNSFVLLLLLVLVLLGAVEAPADVTLSVADHQNSLDVPREPERRDRREVNLQVAYPRRIVSSEADHNVPPLRRPRLGHRPRNGRGAGAGAVAVAPAVGGRGALLCLRGLVHHDVADVQQQPAPGVLFAVFPTVCPRSRGLALLPQSWRGTPGVRALQETQIIRRRANLQNNGRPSERFVTK